MRGTRPGQSRLPSLTNPLQPIDRTPSRDSSNPSRSFLLPQYRLAGCPLLRDGLLFSVAILNSCTMFLSALSPWHGEACMGIKWGNLPVGPFAARPLSAGHAISYALASSSSVCVVTGLACFARPVDALRGMGRPEEVDRLAGSSIELRRSVIAFDHLRGACHGAPISGSSSNISPRA